MCDFCGVNHEAEDARREVREDARREVREEEVRPLIAALRAVLEAYDAETSHVGRDLPQVAAARKLLEDV